MSGRKKGIGWKHASTVSAEEFSASFGATANGLTDAVVFVMRARFGWNELPKDRFGWQKEFIGRQVKSPFLYLLGAAVALSFFLGDRWDGLLILLFIAINAGLDFFQTFHSVRTLDLLEQYLVSHSRVRRNGEWLSIPSRELVPGDRVAVEAGDRLAADIRFLSVTDLALDESVMTGETKVVVKKTAAHHTSPKAMYEADNVGFAGTVVARGRGEGTVVSTGAITALGEIAHLAERATDHQTKFERGMFRFSRFIVRLSVVSLLLVFFGNVLLQGKSANVPELLIFSLALAVSIVPEALPVILTVSLSHGSAKLAKKKVVVKRLSAIEDLGSIEVLCTDKTGTITENDLSVVRVRAENKRKCLVAAATATLADPHLSYTLTDPFDHALWKAISSEERKNVTERERIASLPFDPTRRRNSVLLSAARGREMIVRGAPESVVALSKNLSKEERKQWLALAVEEGRLGRRTLGIARKIVSAKVPYVVDEEADLEWLGLISFADPLKSTAKETILHAEKLKIEVKILTGDSREVAGSVGKDVGLIADASDVMTGSEFDSLSEAEKRSAALRYRVFARVSPEQKYEIIRLIQEKHEVGFLGEGVNDAPALHLADVGIVVRGASDIAREAADVVLLQKNLGVVVDGVREGRAIFGNIMKYMKITMTANIGNFYSMAVASLFIPFVPMLPVQVILLDLLCDFPMIAIATDNVDADELEKPRNYQVADIALVAFVLGAVYSVFNLILFAFLRHLPEGYLQTSWFALNAFTEIVLIFSLRTKRNCFRAMPPSKMLVWLAGTSFVLALVFMLSPFGRSAFHFTAIPISFLFLVLLISSLYFASTEGAKRWFYVAMANGGHLFGSRKRGL